MAAVIRSIQSQNEVNILLYSLYESSLLLLMVLQDQIECNCMLPGTTQNALEEKKIMRFALIWIDFYHVFILRQTKFDTLFVVLATIKQKMNQ